MSKFDFAEWKEKRIASMQSRRFESKLEEFEEGYAAYTTVSDLLNFYTERIRSVSDQINRLVKNYPDDPPIEEKCGEIEENLGLSFVACQFLITDTEGVCLAIHALVRQKTICGHNGRRKFVMRKGCPDLIGTGFSLIEGIDSAANCYKHRATWIGSWDELKKKGNTGRTIDTVEKLGASQGSTGNFRTLFKAIAQSDDFENVNCLLQIPTILAG